MEESDIGQLIVPGPRARQSETELRLCAPLMAVFLNTHMLHFEDPFTSCSVSEFFDQSNLLFSQGSPMTSLEIEKVGAAVTDPVFVSIILRQKR